MKKLKSLSLLMILSIMLGSLTTAQGQASCMAGFQYSINPNGVIQFYDSSYSFAPPLTYLWDFGDGTTSTLQNPTHSMNFAGIPLYVCLTISDTIGCTSTFCDTVGFNTNPNRCFDPSLINQNVACPTVYTPVCGCDGVTYNNDCEATNYGGVTSFTQGPCGGTGSGCQASFTLTADSNGVQFTGVPYNSFFTSYHWDFGDGDTSSLQNPYHTYSSHGIYNVCLTIQTQPSPMGPVCTSTFCDSVLFSGNGNPVGGCIDPLLINPNIACPAIYAPVCGCDGVTYGNDCEATNFGGVTSWTQGPCNNTSNCQAFWYAIPRGLTVDFADASFNVGNQTSSWHWDFGDGTFSTLQNPTHTYGASGIYVACLTITQVSSTGTTCTDTWCDSLFVDTLNSGSCQVGFQYGLTASGAYGFSGYASGTAPYTYSWDFGDNTLGTGANPSHSYNAPGTYLVCVAMTDASGCTATYCDSILYSGNNTNRFYVSGNLFTGNSLADEAIVYLIQFDSVNTLSITAVDSTIVTVGDSGYYSFVNVPQGVYLVKAALEPTASQYWSYLPTYYGDDLFWGQAWPVFVGPGGPFISYDINLVPGNNPGGPGFVGGSVLQGANKRGPGDPLEGIQVMLLDMSDNPVQYTYSDASGNYSFSNVAYGTYQIYVEILGRETVPIMVTIGAQNDQVTDANVVVNSGEVVSGIWDSPIADNLKIQVRPTIVSTELIVEMELTASADVELQLVSLVGQQLFSENKFLQQGNHLETLSVIDLKSGVYLLAVKTNGVVTHTQKIVKF